MPEGSLATGGTTLAEDRLQRSLAGFNAERFDPALPTVDWRQGIECAADWLREEGDFLEARRAAVSARAAAAPTDADGFVAWFEALEGDGPGQNDPLFPWLAENASMEQMC